MSLAELIPAVRSLSRDEKLELRRILDTDLAAQVSPESNAPEAHLNEELLREFTAAALLYQPPVEVTAEGIGVLEQLLAEARAERK